MADFSGSLPSSIAFPQKGKLNILKGKTPSPEGSFTAD